MTDQYSVSFEERARLIAQGREHERARIVQLINDTKHDWQPLFSACVLSPSGSIESAFALGMSSYGDFLVGCINNVPALVGKLAL